MKKTAFTLIEIIIVITIVGILTSMAILAYQGSIERQQMMVFQKSLTATAQQQRSLVSSGKKDGEILQCYGIYFEIGEAPKKIVMDFVDGTCDFKTEKLLYLEDSTSKILSSQISVAGLNFSKSSSALRLVFNPPDGAAKFYDSAGNIFSGDLKIKFSHLNLKNAEFYFNVESLSGKIYTSK